MPAETPSIKHITQTCPVDGCDNEAFVQVIIVKDPALQKRIDMRANLKLENALKQAHKDGEHD